MRFDRARQYNFVLARHGGLVLGAYHVDRWLRWAQGVFKWDDDPFSKAVSVRGETCGTGSMETLRPHPRSCRNSCPGRRKPRSGTATQRTKTSTFLTNEPLSLHRDHLLHGTTTMNAMKYRMVCHQMQIDAQTALSRGDSCKASEYGWGSAVQMVKAVAEDKGCRHLTDDQIVEAIDRIREGNTGTADWIALQPGPRPPLQLLREQPHAPSVADP